MEPIDCNGTPTLSFRQVDEMNGFTKGTAFRRFKHSGDALQEGRDFFYCPAPDYGQWIETLKAEGKVYQTSQHLVLLTRQGYERLQRL
ncbi:hypothetical protein [Halospina sp. K52047b]|uniref:hypothetical protein n=1 Tax=Halospina sp. K52047b TaxID=2614160 RepID=UPI00124A76A9|nr:hypothetical protein [Halospina sp. K52047b]KAA8985465.1 hypothetical protein F3089_01995 [Halospina sp. K52047b]